MDLLRSVLSRQPLERLKAFTPSERFYRFRKELVIPEKDWPQNVGAELFFVACGELSANVPPLIGYKLAMYRALFFLSAPYLLHYRSIKNKDTLQVKPLFFAGSPVPLEQFLETGVPEIQALGLAEGWFSAEYYDYSRVNWNDKLVAAVKKYIPRTVDTQDEGLIEIRLPSYFANPETDIISYIENKYQGEEVTTPDPLVERFYKLHREYNMVLIRAGYSAHFNPKLEPESTKAFALTCARVWLLSQLKEVSLTMREITLYFETILEGPIDWKMRDRVNAIYQDPELWSSIPKMIQESYKMILGITEVDDPYQPLSMLAVKIGYPRITKLWFKGPMSPSYFNPQDICYSAETAYSMTLQLLDNEDQIMAPIRAKFFQLSYLVGSYLGNLVPAALIGPLTFVYQEPTNYRQILKELQ